MRSYAQYRKDQLVQERRFLPIREAIARHFDVLRLELVEASKLPPMLFESSHLAEVTYEHARKEDHEDIKEILEYVLTQYKLHFYDELVAEAETAVANPFADIENQMKAKVKELVATLKAQVGEILSGARPVGDAEEPEASNASGAAPSAAGPGTAPSPGSTTTTPGVGAPVTHTATTGGSPTPGAGPTSPPGAAPAAPGAGDHGGFTPAPYGSIRPSDGFMAGLKRTLYDPIAGWAKDKWRNFRRRWHNDPMREHSVTLERLFLENFSNVMSVIDDFEKNLLDYLTNHFQQLATGGETPPVGPDSTNSTGAPLDPTPATASPSAVSDPNAESDPAKAADPTGEQPAETPLDAIPADQRQEVEVKRSAAAIRGAELLGIKVVGGGTKGGWQGVKPNGLVDAKTGQPIEPTRLVGDKQVDAGWARVRNRLYYLVFSKIEETDPQVVGNLRAEKRKQFNDQGKPKKGSLSLGEKKQLVNSWLGITPTGSKSAILDLLSAYHKKQTKVNAGQTTPPVDGADNQAAAPTQGSAGHSDTDFALNNPFADEEPTGGQPNVTNPPPGAGTSNQSQGHEAQADALIKKLQTQHPDLWNRIIHHTNADEAKIKSIILDDIKQGEDPNNILDIWIKHAQNMPPVPQESGSPTQQSAHQPVEPEAGAEDNSPLPGLDDLEKLGDAGDATPAEDNSQRYRQLIDKHKKDPDNQELAPYIHTDQMSDEELNELGKGIDWDKPNAEGELLTRLIHHNFQKGSETPDTEPESPANAGKPSDADTVTSTTSPTHHNGGTYDELNVNPKYKGLLEKYSTLVGDNLDNEDAGLEARIQIEDKIREKMNSGEYDSNAALAYLQKLVDLEVERGNDPDNYLSKHLKSHGVPRKGDASEPLPDDPKALDKPAENLSDEEKERQQADDEDAEAEKFRRRQLASREKKRNESFNHILNRFKQLIHN